jgi:hypothetical protein
MKGDIQALRDACRGYERVSVIKAASIALGSVIADAEEREELASILATWLDNEEPAMAEPPPLQPSVINAIRRELRARTQ